MLRIYNSLSRQKETFAPISEGKVGIYVCGMTVYDYCHIGHARVLVAFDVVRRYLMARGYVVTFVRNITDIDDKIIARSLENGEPIEQLTGRFIGAMHEDAAALSVLPPDQEPRATNSIGIIIDMIASLVEKGYAYQGSTGDVYYRVKKFPGYGRLSGKNIDELQSGSRVAVEEAKEDPLDFVLWKLAKPDEPSWPSPWGDGRPGWHIECSAMSVDCLGSAFDIHGGGMDLQFPHHENEIAQACAATGDVFAHTWMHNGFVQINDEKMSKSLGNFFTVREVLVHYDPEVIRYFIIASHYRSPLNYSDAQLENARAALERFYIALRGLPLASTPTAEDSSPGREYLDRFNKAMDDDFNTPLALEVMFDLVREINRLRQARETDRAVRLARLLVSRMGAVLGILQRDAESFLKQGALTDSAAGDGLSESDIEALIDERNAARAARDWAEADRIRAQLEDSGVVIEDGPEGTSWRRS